MNGAMLSPVKPSRYRWVILAVVWFSYLNVFLTRLSIGPLAPFLKETFDLSNAQIGSLVSATVIGYAPSLIISGWFVDRFGVKRMLVGGTMLMGICVSILFLTPSYYFMWGVLVVSGAGAGAIFPSAVKGIMSWFPVRERATALGINQASVNVGGIIGASVLPTTALTLGWRYGFLFVGLASLVICICCAFIYRNPPGEASPETADNQNTGKATGIFRSTLELLKSRDILMLGLATLFLAVVEFSAMAYLVLYLTESLFYGVVVAGGLLAMTEAAGAFGKPLSGFVSDYFFGGRRKIVFLFMPVTAAVLCLLIGFSGDTLGWFIYPVLITMGVVAIGWGGLYATMAGELGGERMAGAATGTTAAIIMVGVIVGPPVFGFIVDATGSFSAAWLALAVSSVISAVFAWLIHEPSK
ncbi:MFS transporter [Chloroflexota bacterium]